MVKGITAFLREFFGLFENTYFSDAAKFLSKNATVLLKFSSVKSEHSSVTKLSKLAILFSNFLPPTYKQNNKLTSTSDSS